MSSEKKDLPSIKPTPDGPYVVEGLKNFKNRKGEIETKEKMALCRCGGSNNKPFCDGTHARNGFSSAKLEGRVEDKQESYVGEGVTIHDNRGICAHAGRCTDGLPAVFQLGKEPWINPKGASTREVTETIRKCPSGALSYTLEGEDQPRDDEQPAVFVAPNGPYVASGGPNLLDTSRGEGASTEHFTLCRCGGSKNKPFCDGTHWHNKFTDDRN